MIQIANILDLSIDETYYGYRQYYADILLYARYSLNNPEETAKDITSDAFTKLLGKWSDFNPKTSGALIAWLRKTARFLT